MTEVAIYITIDGLLRLATKSHIALFTFLNKLGIKSAPDKSTMIICTNVMPGDYSISYTFNGQEKTGVITVPGTITSHIEVDFKIPKVHKKKRGPSPEEKYSWHTTKQKHSQNTGLKLRLGGRR